MTGKIFRGLALSAFATALLGVPGAHALTRVDTCRDLPTARETYLVTQDLSTSGNGVCFTVKADGITLDLGGHTITGGGAGTNGAAVFDGQVARQSTTIKNGRIEQFGFGIFLFESSRTTIRDITVVDSVINGITLGTNALVKDCTVQRSGQDGIVMGNAGQVQSCLIGGDYTSGGDDLDGNGRYGIVAGQKALITANTVGHNGRSGILTGIQSTVSHNTSNDNGEDGIAVGLKSLVTYNEAHRNADDGIEAVCPSTITNNEVSGNGQNLRLIDIGQGACFEKNNVQSNPT